MTIKDTLKKLSKPSLDFTLLTEDQIWGDDALDVMKKYGTKVAPTDLAVLLGGCMTGLGNRTSEKEFTCGSWSRSFDSSEYAVRIDCLGNACRTLLGCRKISARPVLQPSETEKLQLDAPKKGVNGVDMITYGEYPQTVVDKRTFLELERAYNLKSIYPTGKSYTFDSVDLTDYSTPFKAQSYPEYELLDKKYSGRKYIRISGRPYDGDSRLSNGEQVTKGKAYWVEVQPVEWLMDKSGTMVAKKCLFAGIQFDTRKIHNVNFKNTFMKKYLDTYFGKEIEIAGREVIQKLNTKLSEINDLEKLKAMVTPARTPERTEKLARITRVRKAKALLSAAAQKAYKDGDEATLKEIVEIAKPYAAREAAIRQKAMVKRLERRAAHSKGDRE